MDEATNPSISIERLKRNRLLATLPTGALRRLDRSLHSVKLKTGQILNEPGDKWRHAFFPEDAVISVVNLMQEGRAIEVGAIGREGVSCVPALLGAEFVPFRYVVQIPGSALRMPTAELVEAARPESPLWRLSLRYFAAFTSQVMQSVACAGLHTVKQRCCRWLLETHDRVERDQFALTHEFLAIMLGTRRTSVSQVLKRLQDRGLIRYRRGIITIIDRRGLEARSCECYRTVSGFFRRVRDSGGAI
jgi:CRP-like cAMP-binding protein